MHEIDCLSDSTDWMDVDFVQRERTPERITEVGTQLHLAGLSPSNTNSISKSWVSNGVGRPSTIGGRMSICSRPAMRCRITSQPTRRCQVNDERRSLYAAVSPETNEFPHARLFSTRTTQLTVLFLRELRQIVPVTQATILVDDARRLKAALSRLGLQFQMRRHGNRNAVERVFREIKRRTSSSSEYVQSCAADDG